VQAWAGAKIIKARNYLLHSIAKRQLLLPILLQNPYPTREVKHPKPKKITYQS